MMIARMIYLKPEQLDALREMSKAQDRPWSRILRSALDEYIARHSVKLLETETEGHDDGLSR